MLSTTSNCDEATNVGVGGELKGASGVELKGVEGDD
jgi:hypothetical protein